MTRDIRVALLAKVHTARWVALTYVAKGSLSGR